MRKIQSVIFLAVLLLGLDAVAQTDCISSIRSIPFTSQELSAPLAKLVPKNAFVRLVMPLSSTVTLTIYELGDRMSPDTQLLVTRSDKGVFRYSFGKLDQGTGDDWFKSLVSLKAVHVCAESNDLTYLILQTGNQGGFFAVLVEDEGKYKLIPIASVQQGKLEVSVNHPRQIVVWTVAKQDAAECTGCPKHYTVRILELKGSRFELVDQRRSSKRYESFQDDPLLVKP